MTLRARCIEFINTAQRNAVMRQGSPVDELMAFVVAETGRDAEPNLANSLPVCLYFPTQEDREEFIEAVLEAKPGMTVRRMP